MNEEYLRIPPQSSDAEICVLGSMLKLPDSLREAAAEIKPDWFYRPANRILFETMVKMAAGNLPVDAVLLRQTLRDAGQYENIGGDEYILEITSGTPDASSIAHYGDILRDKAAKRALITSGAEMVSQGYDSTVTAIEAIGDAHAALQKITEGQCEANDVSISDAIRDALDRAEKVVRGECAAGLATGFCTLDREILSGGLREAESVVIAADTSVGKTVVGCDFARNFCKLGYGSLIASAEMPGRELANRLLSAESSVPINTIRSGRYSEGEMNAIFDAKARMDEWKLHILEGNRTIADIAATAKRINMRWNGQLGAVIVDYLQIMLPEDTGVNRELQVGTMALRCKQAANQMKIPWIMMAQFNRAHTQQRKPPTMSNLRDSGQIEQHANIIILLHPTNDRHMEAGLPSEGLGYYEIALYVPKNRNGMTHGSWEDAITRKVRRFCGRTEA